MKRIVVLIISYFLVTQSAFGAAEPTNACSHPTIDATTSSLTVSVEPSTMQVNQTVTVAAHNGMVYSLSLTKDSTLVARFKVAGGLNNQIRVMLLDMTNFELYQSHQKYSYFRGTTGEIRNTGHYSFKVPETNVYKLVVDNSEAWLLDRQVELYIYSVSPIPTPQSAEFEKYLTTAFSHVGELFIFPTFKIDLSHCGMVNAFSNPNITLCTELVEYLSEHRLEQAITFVFFHELGHSMMRLWGLPLWDNEDVADEFAAVCMILLKLQQPGLQAAKWYSSDINQQQALSKLWIDDRHSLSPQRARNIIRWLNQPDDLLQRWMRLMTPHLQTPILSELISDSRLTPVKDVMQTELQRRGCGV